MSRFAAVPKEIEVNYTNRLILIGTVYDSKGIGEFTFFDLFNSTLNECFEDLYLQIGRICEVSKLEPTPLQAFNKANKVWKNIIRRCANTYISKYLDKNMFKDHTISLSEEDINKYFNGIYITLISGLLKKG